MATSRRHQPQFGAGSMRQRALALRSRSVSSLCVECQHRCLPLPPQDAPEARGTAPAHMDALPPNQGGAGGSGGTPPGKQAAGAAGAQQVLDLFGEWRSPPAQRGQPSHSRPASLAQQSLAKEALAAPGQGRLAQRTAQRHACVARAPAGVDMGTATFTLVLLMLGLLRASMTVRPCWVGTALRQPPAGVSGCCMPASPRVAAPGRPV